MKLRPYQIDIIEKLKETLKTNTAILVQLPTGGGKTVIMSKFINFLFNEGINILQEKNINQIIMIAHRDFLIEQMKAKTENEIKGTVNVKVGKKQIKGNYPVTVTTIQTITRNFNPKELNQTLLIIDETHRATAKSYLKIIKNAKITIGFTATPTRNDNKIQLHQIFTAWIKGPNTSWMIKNGYLAEPKVIPKPTLITNNVKITKGDYDQNQLYDQNKSKEKYQNIVNAQIYAEKIAEKKLQTIVYAINREHAQEIKNQFLNNNINAKYIDGETPNWKRNLILQSFKNKETQILVNVEIFTEGYDLPQLDAVILARPTKSISLLIQMIGRALRTHQDKQFGYVIDCANNILQHFGENKIKDVNFNVFKTKANLKPKINTNHKEKPKINLQIAQIDPVTKTKKTVAINQTYKKAWQIYQQQAKTIGRARQYRQKCKYSTTELVPAAIELAMIGGQFNYETKEEARNRFIKLCQTIGYKNETILKYINQARQNYQYAIIQNQKTQEAIQNAAEALKKELVKFHSTKKN